MGKIPLPHLGEQVASIFLRADALIIIYIPNFVQEKKGAGAFYP